MLARTSLSARAFLFSFLPVCVVLAASIAALNALVQQHVKSGLRDSLQKSEEMLDRANADYSRRIGQFVSVVADNAGLKAAVGLTREAPSSPETAENWSRGISSGLRSSRSPLVRPTVTSLLSPTGRRLLRCRSRVGDEPEVVLNEPHPSSSADGGWCASA